MKKIHPDKYGTYADLAVAAKVLGNAYEDLMFDDQGINGRLCDEIAELGYIQAEVVERLFTHKQRTVLETRLAGRVCESCVFWQGCERLIVGDAPIDETDRFGLQWNPETASIHTFAENHEVHVPRTTKMRNEQIALTAARG